MQNSSEPKLPKTKKSTKKVLPERRNGLYYLNDKKYVSITTALQSIAKPQLIPWAAKGAARAALDDPTLSENEALAAIYGKRDEKAKLGSVIHSLLEMAEQGAKMEVATLPPDYRGYVTAYNKFHEDWQPEPVVINGKTIKETTVFSDKYGIAGKLDTVLKVRSGQVGIVDFKTGGVYDEAQLQGEAYKVCVEEMGLLKPDFTATLQLKPDGTYLFHENAGNNFHIFYAALVLWKWQHPEMVEVLQSTNKEADNG